MTSKAEVEAAFAEVAREERKLCNLGRQLASQPDDLREVFEAKVADVSHYGSETIAKTLKRFGIIVSKDTVNQHRKGTCRCPRDDA